MLVSNEPVKREIPHEPGEWMLLRRLPMSDITEIQEEKAKKDQKRATGMMKELGPEFFKQMREGSREESEEALRRLEDLQWHIENFDLPQLLAAGIHEWSYTNGAGEQVPVPTDPTAVLDARTALWAGKEIIAITRPPTKKEEEDFLPRSSTSSTDDPDEPHTSGV